MIVKITRVFPEARACFGLVVYINKDILIMREFNDHRPDGYSVVRMRDVATARSDTHERFWERVLTSEGVISSTNSNHMYSFCARDMRDAMEQREGEYVLLECESTDEDQRDDEFYLGKIESVRDEVVSLTLIDGDGERHDSSIDIAIDEVTKLQFDAPYIDILVKYSWPSDA